MKGVVTGRGVVIVAAGASRRMGRSKAELPFNPYRVESGTFLDRVVDLGVESCARERVVVVGRAGQPRVDGVRWVVNERPERGMFSSVQVGLREVWEAGVRVMVMLVDHPLVRRSTVRKLWGAAERAGGASRVVMPVYARRAGHPVVLGPEVVRAALEANAESRLDRVIEGFEREEVVVGDPAVVRDVDTAERYRYWIGPLD